MNNKTTFLLLLLFVFLSINTNAATYTVTKISDAKTKSIVETLADKSDCELREAVQAANSTPEDDVIEFDPNVFGEKQTIVLDGSLRIEGDTKGSLTIDGNGVTITAPNAAVIIVSIGQTLTLTGTTISGGSDGGIQIDRGTANLINCTVRDNTSNFLAGGIFNFLGTLYLLNSTVSRNSTGRFGGGISNFNGLVTLINSTVTGNSAVRDGGGIDNSSFDPINIKNTVIAGNSAGYGPDCDSLINSQGYNLIGNTGGTTISGDTTGNILNQNALLGPLQDNGGPTWTHALLANSPAIDGGNNSLAIGSTDQRGTGFPRIIHRKVDMGAFESTNQINEIVVDNTGDNGSLSACTAAANDCSLRGAISRSVSGVTNAISFDSNVFSTPQTITLTTGELLILGTAIDIEIRGRSGLTISGNNASRIFYVNQATLTLYDVTISNGRADSGGGIYIQTGKLTINNSTISSNVVTSSSIAIGAGGGIFNDSGSVEIFNSTFSGNRADAVSDNPLSYGGAIYNNVGSLKLTNSTVAFNTGQLSGGILNQNGTVISGNSIIANNFAVRGFDFGGTLTSQGYNLIGNTQDTVITGTTTGNKLNVLANLAPLANNGGGPFTHALLAGSSAVNAGSNELARDENFQPMTNDQRGAGFPRRVEQTDIGAFESTVRTTGRTMTVDTISDNIDLTACTNAANDCSLRGAILTAESPAENTISFDPVVFAASQTITLTSGELRFFGSNLNNSLTINGINGLRISGGNANRIFNFGLGTIVSLNNLTLTNGGFVTEGGAIFNSGTVTITNSTISGNSAINNGGAIYQGGGALSLINSTVSSNIVNIQGGGIYVGSGTVNLTNSTIAYNTANNGGGIFNFGGTVNSGNSIIGNNFGATGFDFSGTLNSQGYNLIGNTSLTNITGVTTGNILSRTIQVGPLQDNGGGTFTHAFLSGSPAINAGSNSLALDSAGQPLTTDQRGAGFPRIVNGRVDIGAFETTLLPPPPNFLVDTTTDDNLTDCTVAPNDCSLRGALALANATAGNETITFDTGVFASSQTITLTNGHIPVNNDSIAINAINGLMISGNNASRIFVIGTGATLSLNNLTLTSGFQGGDGGAIFSQGTLNITNSTISANRATERGGGIFNFAGTVNLVNSTLSGNFLNAVSQGGGIYNLSGTVNTTNSTITNNTAGEGGGIYGNGTVNLTNSNISNNSAGSGFGGGIYNRSATVNATNSTISGNSTSSGFGGGIYSITGIVTTTNSTIANNTAATGGGIYNDSGTVNAGNTIIAANNSAASPDFFGTLNSLGYNLISNTNLTNITGITTGNLLNINAGLAPLANNGGSTFTHQLAETSPAVDAGSNALAVDANGQPLATDQRGAGFSRITNSLVDIGSVEIRDRTFFVDNLSDNGSLTACTIAANDCSLRGAISRSQLSINATILFDPIVFAAPQTITLTNGQLAINSQGGTNLTIKSSNGVTISGNNLLRVLFVSVASNTTLEGLTITSGSVADNGGGIYSFGSLTINNCTISGNRAGANSSGGGIFQSGNQLSITNSTISGNSAFAGAGIFMSANTLLQNVTITNNTAVFGGGIGVDSSIVLRLGRSIIAGNSATLGVDIDGSINSLGYNLIGNTDETTITGSTTGNILNQAARLSPLGYYGGTTQTHALLSGSPAINAGNTAASPTLDQRGASRIGTADIGAFELNNTANGGTFVAALPNGSQGSNYNFTLVPNNNSFTYSITSGSLPNGLSLTNNFAGNNADAGFTSPTAVVAISGTPTQGGTFNFAITATGLSSNVTTNYSLFVLASTAAQVSISGRVTTAEGRGVRNAIVSLTDQQGVIRTARTGSFGYYRFDDIESGQTFVISVRSRRFQFTPRIVSVQDELADIDFIAEPESRTSLSSR